jgi:hypothetical protein
MRTMMLITIITLMTVAFAKAEETLNVKVKNYVTAEINDIKEYQKTQWQAGKEQNAKNWESIKSFFTKVKNNVTQN